MGPGRAIDPDRYRIVGIDYLGGSGASSGPGIHRSVDTADQARAVVAVLDHLRIPRVHRIVGASYGGMVALRIAAGFPDRVASIVVISAAHRPHPMATALRSAQRAVVRLNVGTPGERASLAIARGIAMTTYRTEREFTARFDITPHRSGDRYRFPIEEYLEHAGATFARRVPAECFVPLSESIDLHQLDPTSILTPTTLVCVEEDRLVPAWLMTELREGLGGPAEMCTIRSVYGHDAFLKETGAISSIVHANLRVPHE